MSISTNISTQHADGSILIRGHDFNDMIENFSYEKIAYCLLYEKEPSDEELIQFNERGTLVRRMTAESLKTGQQRFFASPIITLQSLSASILIYYDDWDYINQLLMSMCTFYRYPIRVMDNYESQLQWMISHDGYPINHESYFVGLMNLYSENAAQASTLVARAVASTKAETPTACSAAFGAMSGLEESKQLELVLPWVQEMTFATYRQKLKDMYERGYIFHGFAVQQESKNYYAKTAKKIAELLSDRQERYGALFQLAACIEEELALLGNLYPTLDYYTALSLSFLEIPAGSFSIFYAFSRITGIIAHIGEQRLSKEVLSINFPMIGFNNPSTEA